MISTQEYEEEQNIHNGDHLNRRQIDSEGNNDGATVHTSLEDPVLYIGITEEPLNNFLNQIMVIKVVENPIVINSVTVFQKLNSS